MQTLSQIRELLASDGLAPRKRLGQNFLIDGNLMGKLLELADTPGSATVLEVGPATGSLTEGLVTRARKVVAVEVDTGLAGILRRRLGRAENLAVLNCSILAGKHTIAAEVLDALAGTAELHLVANLPYNIAVPLIINCLLLSWQSAAGCRRNGPGRQAAAPPGSPVRFDRLTFTVQRELSERLCAGPGSKAYGPVSVIVALMAKAQPGRLIPPEAFWPRPKVRSQMLRLDFDAALAEKIIDSDVLSAVLSATFGQRRKKISAPAKRSDLPFGPEDFMAALSQAGIDPDLRPEQVRPQSFLAVANALSPARQGVRQS